MTEIRFAVWADGKQVLDTMVKKDAKDWESVARSYPEYYVTVIDDKVIAGEKPDERLKIEWA